MGQLAGSGLPLITKHNFDGRQINNKYVCPFDSFDKYVCPFDLPPLTSL
jgi:hypothetical protein